MWWAAATFLRQAHRRIQTPATARFNFSDKTPAMFSQKNTNLRRHRRIQTKSADSDKNVCLNIQTFVLVLCPPGFKNRMSRRNTFSDSCCLFWVYSGICSFCVCVLVAAQREWRGSTTCSETAMRGVCSAVTRFVFVCVRFFSSQRRTCCF